MRRWLLYAAPVLLGAAIATLWIWLVGGAALLEGLRQVSPAAFAMMLAVTGWWLLARFIRWQFLLRRAGVRVPIRPSLAIYLAGLPGTATPAYVGELIRGVLLKRECGVSFGLSTGVLVLERCWDVAVLGLLLAVLARGWIDIAVASVAVALALMVALGLRAVAHGAETPATVRQTLSSPTTLMWSAALSLLVWSGAALLPWLAAWGLGEAIGPIEGARLFARSTLLGAATLLPAGVGATGTAMILELGDAGLTLTRAVTVVSLVRLAGVGFALSLGAAALWVRLHRRTARPAPEDAAAHFDDIAAVYHEQFAPHVWDHLLERKLGLIQSALPQPPAHAGLGLDLGCGLGRQTAELARRGYRVVGIDPAARLLAQGARGDYAAADALALPFVDGSFDFVYVIGVLHHLAGPDGQAAAYREAQRVLRPGGVLLIHETNPRNPLFRFYMGYVFPLLKKIDEGTEWWVDPTRLHEVDGFQVERIEYFTFMPDFTPRALLPLTHRVERRLERGEWRRYSAHYLAVLRRGPSEPPGAEAGAELAAAVSRDDAR